MSLFSNNQIDVSTLPKSEALVLKPIALNYFKIILFNIMLCYFLLIGMLTLLNFIADDNVIKNAFWYVVAIISVLCLVSILLCFIGFKKRKYAIREKDMTYSHGYLINKTITLPYNRIQHIEIARSFLARKLGLSTLKIYSAGQSGGDISIKGLPKEVADTQYAFLTKIINERI